MAATLPTSGHRSSDDIGDNFNTERSTIQRSRRQWNIQEGPRGVLRRMRSQLAEEGDPDSQVVLAKTLLSHDDGDVECSRQAVYWLTKASLQGHCGATEMLQECLQNATGISEHNYHEVRQCLDMPLQEKLARRAASSLFVSLSGGSDFVTSSMLASYVRQLLRRGSDPAQPSPPPSPQPCSLEERYGGERFLQEHLTAAATSYYQGQLPTLHQFLPTLRIHETRKNDWKTARRTSTLPDASSTEITDASVTVGQVIRSKIDTLRYEWHSRVTSELTNFSDRLVKYFGVEVGKKIRRWYYGITSTKLILLMICVVACFSTFRGEDFSTSVPLVCLILSLIAMIVSSATIFMNYQYLDQFKVWSVLLKHHCPELDTDVAEEKFCSGWHIPFLTMLTSLLVFLSSSPFVSSFILSIFLPVFGFVSFLSLSCSLKRVGFCTHLPLTLFALAKCTDFLTVPNFDIIHIVPDPLKVYTDYFKHLNSDIVLSDTLRLHISVSSISHVVSIFLLFVLTLRRGYLSFATVMLTAAWLNLFFSCMKFVHSPMHLVYCSLTWVTVFFSPAIMNLVVFFTPVAGLALLGWFTSLRYDLMLGTILFYVACQFLLQKYFPGIFKIIKTFIVWISIICVVVGGTYHPAGKDRKIDVKWTAFRNICVPSKSVESNTWIACQPLQGMLVSWSGEVVDVKVTSLTNWPKSLISVLPLPDEVHNFVACLVGREAVPCNRMYMELVDYERCVLVSKILGKDRCVLDDWDSYVFTLTLAMDSANWKFGKEGMTIEVNFGNEYKQSFSRLSVGEEVEFEGILSEGVGTKSLRVKGTKLKCRHCLESPEQLPNLLVHDSSTYVRPIVASLCSFFLNPTVLM